MEILIRREYPANKPKKSGYYLAINEDSGAMDVVNNYNGNWQHTLLNKITHFFEPLTIDGAEELRDEIKRILRTEMSINTTTANSYESHLNNACESLLPLFSASRVEEKPEIEIHCKTEEFPNGKIYKNGDTIKHKGVEYYIFLNKFNDACVAPLDKCDWLRHIANRVEVNNSKPTTK